MTQSSGSQPFRLSGNKDLDGISSQPCGEASQAKYSVSNAAPSGAREPHYDDEGCIECDWGEQPCHCSAADLAGEPDPRDWERADDWFNDSDMESR